MQIFKISVKDIEENSDKFKIINRCKDTDEGFC